MDDLKLDKEQEEAKFSEDAERQMKMVDNLRDELESVKQSLETVRLNLTSCSSELAAERADRLLVPPQGAGQQHHQSNSQPHDLGPGQLPDVNPQAVNVVRKETHGMSHIHPGLGFLLLSPWPILAWLSFFPSYLPMRSKISPLYQG